MRIRKLSLLLVVTLRMPNTLHDPHRVSTVPLTISSPKHRTMSLHALTESQATKPSRRWQPPRVTSTIGLQHEHLVPLDANSQCNALESLTRY